MDILIVDDDPAALHSLQFFLESEGYTIVAFNSGPELLAELPHANPACVVIDCKMPKMDGLEVYRNLRLLNRSVPVVMVTGHPDPGIRRSVERVGLELIEKPLSQETILSVVRRVQSDRDLHQGPDCEILSPAVQSRQTPAT